LPRGGVIVGGEIARLLNIPLSIIIARKIGHPLQPEFAIAAITENGHLVSNKNYLEEVPLEWFKNEVSQEQTEAKRKRTLYTPFLKNINSKGKIFILVDDGIATGLTTKAAISDLKDRNPKKLILAVPVIPQDSAEEIKTMVDELTALAIPKDFLGAVGAYYQEFPQVSDEEVVKILKEVNNY
ncbi:MAG: phosphoribosyl transferase, partial [Patescibacteria group bacterium]|nr:phosphoribosyl transferase [Patescibacteria group bacterium]